MARAAWPTVAQLTDALQAVGVLAIPLTARQQKLDLQGFLDSAVDEFQHHTGLEPFLVEEDDSTRRYDPPGPHYRERFWQIGGGRTLLFTPDPPYQEISEVWTGDDIDTGQGEQLTEDEDYVLEPVNRQENTAITSIRFRWAIIGPRYSVKIVGKVGYYTEIPEGIWQAVLSGAAAMVLEHLREGIVSRPTDWREGDSAEKYNVETLLKLGATHQKRFDDAISSHRVIRI